jgi:hypothetical protein
MNLTRRKFLRMALESGCFVLVTGMIPRKVWASSLPKNPRLGDLDGMTLGDLDALTLGDLDGERHYTYFPVIRR